MSLPIKIKVNEKHVEMPHHEANGLQIKEAAIAQGVDIKRDFALSEELEGGRTRVVGDDEKIALHDGQKFFADALDIKISVNEKPVTMHRHKANGLQIKEAAIAQGVNIKTDFVLSVELGERRTRAVGDTDTIELYEGQKFIAVTPDDNS
ncbi:MAG TPA: multiubiquitin domain-containing protein [Polyangiaceae bacterium]|jgi:hypothetical protein